MLLYNGKLTALNVMVSTDECIVGLVIQAIASLQPPRCAEVLLVQVTQ